MKTKSFTILIALACALVPRAYGASDVERELKRLMDERDQAIAAASAPITARFKLAAEHLLQRAMAITRNKGWATYYKLTSGREAAPRVPKLGEWRTEPVARNR